MNQILKNFFIEIPESNMKNTTINCTIVHVYIACILLSLIVITSGCMSMSPPANNSPDKHLDVVNGTPLFIAIASPIESTGLALRSDGRIVCWGWNYNGICDIPRTLTNVASIYPMNYAVKKDGNIAAWGGSHMVKVVPSNLTGVVSITRSQFCYLALTEDGTVKPWNCRNDTQRTMIANLSGFTSISGNLGLKKDGTVVSWINDENVLSSYLSNLSDVIAISNNGDYYTVLKKDGLIVAWKVTDLYDENKSKVHPITAVGNLTDIRAISASYDHILALKRDGTVFTFTNDSLKLLDVTDIAAISAGYPDLALTDDGSVVASGGGNTYGQLFTPGILDNVKSISSGDNRNIILRTDGTIATWGAISGTFQERRHEPQGIGNVTGILADNWNHYILMNNRTIYGWQYLQYGPYPVEWIPHPYLTLFGGNKTLVALSRNGNLIVLSHDAANYNILGRLDNVTDISSNGGSCILALKSDGTVSVWNYDGVERTDVPKNLSGVVAVSAGVQHYLAVKKDGTVIAWGENAMGQTDVPSGLSGVTAVSAGVYHSLALKKNGTVVCWGSNKFGECNVPENLHDVVAISAGSGQSLALKKNGTIVAWGKTVIPDWYG